MGGMSGHSMCCSNFSIYHSVAVHVEVWELDLGAFWRGHVVIIVTCHVRISAMYGYLQGRPHLEITIKDETREKDLAEK